MASSSGPESTRCPIPPIIADSQRCPDNPEHAQPIRVRHAGARAGATSRSSAAERGHLRSLAPWHQTADDTGPGRVGGLDPGPSGRPGRSCRSGRPGSILSIGSAGSILSIGSVGLGGRILSARARRPASGLACSQPCPAGRSWPGGHQARPDVSRRGLIAFAAAGEHGQVAVGLAGGGRVVGLAEVQEVHRVQPGAGVADLVAGELGLHVGEHVAVTAARRPGRRCPARSRPG